MGVFDVDKVELLISVVQRYGYEPPARQGWTAIHCISPEHLDRNRSASINLGKGRYNCHGCGLQGDGFDLMKEIEGLDAAAALTALKMESGVSEPEWLF